MLDWQVFFVDDGSSDHSIARIEELHRSNPNFKLVALSRNFGHHQAISAGLQQANGEYFLLMDGDQQDPPEEIPKLFHELQKGFDIVHGIRAKRHVSSIRSALGSLFWWIIRKASGLPIPGNQSILRIFRKPVWEAVRQWRGEHKFYAGIFAYVGFTQTAVEINRDPRAYGETKYTAGKLFRLTHTAFTAFGDRIPSYIFRLGGFTLLLSLLSLLLPFITSLQFATAMLLFWSGLMTSFLIWAIALLARYRFHQKLQGSGRPEFIIGRTLGL